MKFLLLGVLLLTTSCSSFRYTNTKRSIAFIDCVTHLNNEGLRPDYIERFCTKAVDR